MEIKGIVKKVGEVETVSEKFKKRELVITVEGTYPQHISVQATQDKVVMFDGLRTGQEVTAHLNLRGREWTSPSGEVKYFNTIECWKLEAKEVKSAQNSVAQQVSDDLPF